MQCPHFRQIAEFANALILAATSICPALFAAEEEVGLLYNMPGTYQVPAVNFVGNSVSTSSIALRAGGTANVEITHEFIFSPILYSLDVNHAIGVEALDDSMVTVFPAANSSIPNYQVRNFNRATGLIAKDRSVVDFQGYAWVVCIGRDANFAQVNNDAQLLFSGSLALQRDGHGDAVGFVLADRSFLSMTGMVYIYANGTDGATGVRASGFSESLLTGGFEVSAFGNGGANLVSLGDLSTAIVAGSAQIVDRGTGDALLLDASGRSWSLITGSGSVSDTGNGNAIGVRATDQSIVDIRGNYSLAEEGNGNAIGVQAAGQSIVDFCGDYSLVEAGNGSIVFFDVKDQAQVNSRGAMHGTASGNGDGTVVRLAQRASLDLTAGLLALDFRGVPRLELLNQSTMTWSGGQIVSQFEGGTFVPLFTLSDTSTLRIRVQSFDGELGPVKEFQDRLSGILADGSSFVFDFQRSAGAAIVLVPEPALANVLVAIGMGLVCVGRKRSIE